MYQLLKAVTPAQITTCGQQGGGSISGRYRFLGQISVFDACGLNLIKMYGWIQAHLRMIVKLFGSYDQLILMGWKQCKFSTNTKLRVILNLIFLCSILVESLSSAVRVHSEEHSCVPCCPSFSALHLNTAFMMPFSIYFKSLGLPKHIRSSIQLYMIERLPSHHIKQRQGSALGR